MANREFENKYKDLGYTAIAGVDEAGRGPLAGPLVVVALVLPLSFNHSEINDSKKLSAKKRVELFEVITANAIAYNIQVVDEKTIDKLNIYQATKHAMKTAVNSLKLKVEVALTDAMPLDNMNCLVEPIIKGDAKSISIAAASILAKVTRDRIMEKLDKNYPEYGFKQHKGYPTKQHIAAIKKYGITKHHRKSYKPVSDALQLSLFK